MRGWRPLLRLAWRDALRARGRSVLVLVMIALPVLAVTAADVLLATAQVSSHESVGRRLGAATAEVTVQPGVTRVTQGVDPGAYAATTASSKAAPVTLAQVGRVLGRPVRGVERREGSVLVRVRLGITSANATEIDLRSPLVQGMWRVTEGRPPASRDEVAISQGLADRGPRLGGWLRVVHGPSRKVVGIVASTTYRSGSFVVGPLGSLGLGVTKGQHDWFLGGAPVSWRQVRALNAIGASVLSRQVLLHPPAASQLPPGTSQPSIARSQAPVIALVVTMVLLEVVLLAGPAFAVTARRQARSLALLSATGGTPKHSRRVVLANGLVLGGVAAGVGLLGGILLAVALLPRVQLVSTKWFGPFDLRWTQLLGIALFGLLSALLAAVVPAWVAGRQDVVTVLAGRRGEGPPGVRSPIAGVVLLGISIAVAVAGARGNGTFQIAGAALLSVLGMILLVPVVLILLSRGSRWLPLTLRYAVRDASRHRTRTVPAVAAVAATVAAVVALGIANSSDGLQARETYAPRLPMGTAALFNAKPSAWPALQSAVSREIPGQRVQRVTGTPDQQPDSAFLQLTFQPAGGVSSSGAASYSNALGAWVLVSDGSRPIPLLELRRPDIARRAARMLGRGGVVVFWTAPLAASQAMVSVQRFASDGSSHRAGSAAVPAMFVRSAHQPATAQAVISPAVARRLGLPVRTVGLFLDGPTISMGQEQNLSDTAMRLSPSAGLYVERGYQNSNKTRVLLLVLGALGAVLMLGGTLTATFLALSDARPDLATLAAVGATPRTRRAVASAYALVVGGVGAILGALIGAIPGIAVSYPLTSSNGQAGVPDHYLDIPWLLILGLVVALPALTALVVGLAARSRLPMVARLG